MKYKLLVLLFQGSLLIFCSLLDQSTMAQWQPCGGPSGSGAFRLASDSSDIYACTWQGFYLSSNNGGSWTSPAAIGLPGPFGIAAMRVSGNKLYADVPNSYTTSLLYVSTDQATNFTDLSNGYTFPIVNCVTVSGNNIYLGTITGVEVSTNYGSIWTLQNTGFINANVKDILVSGTTILAATPGGVYKSTNNGANWSLTSLQSNIVSFATDGSNIYAAGTGMFVSSDNGATCSLADTGLPTDFVATQIIIANGNAFTCDASYGAFVTPLSIINWSVSNAGLLNTYVKCLTSLGNDIYCGNRTGISRSVNNGSYWTAVNTGLNTLNVYSMVVDSPALYVVTDIAGVFRSDDFAATWLPIDSGFPQNSAFLQNSFTGTLAAHNNKVLTVASAAIYLSSNSGASWSEVFSPIVNMQFNALAIKGNVLFAGTNDSGVYVSHDLGATWARMNYGLPGSNITLFTVSDTVIYAVVYDAGVFRSFDDGVTWNIFNVGLGSLDCSQLSGTLTDVYAVAGGKIYKSNNSAPSWTYLYGPIPTPNYGNGTQDLSWIGAENNNVFAAPFYNCGCPDPKFVAHSNDAGITWSLDTLTDPDTIYSILLSRNVPSWEPAVNRCGVIIALQPALSRPN